MVEITAEIRNGIAVASRALARTLPEALEAGVLRVAQDTAGLIRREVVSTFPSGRTGQLGRSYKETFLGWDGTSVSAGALSDLVYAEVLNKGGTIKPRSRRNLAIPILSGRNLPVGKWPRHFGAGELQLITRKGKPPLLARVKKNRVEPLFVLKPSVTIRGRFYLEKVKPEAAKIAEEVLGNSVEIAVERLPGKA